MGTTRREALKLAACAAIVPAVLPGRIGHRDLIEGETYRCPETDIVYRATEQSYGYRTVAAGFEPVYFPGAPHFPWVPTPELTGMPLIGWMVFTEDNRHLYRKHAPNRRHAKANLAQYIWDRVPEGTLIGKTYDAPA